MSGWGQRQSRSLKGEKCVDPRRLGQKQLDQNSLLVHVQSVSGVGKSEVEVLHLLLSLEMISRSASVLWMEVQIPAGTSKKFVSSSDSLLCRPSGLWTGGLLGNGGDLGGFSSAPRPPRCV